eukprot:6229082-Prymnesium_polylepis.1
MRGAKPIGARALDPPTCAGRPQTTPHSAAHVGCPGLSEGAALIAPPAAAAAQTSTRSSRPPPRSAATRAC